MEQNGKAEPQRAVASLAPLTPADSDGWGERLAVLDRRLTEAREAVERLAACIQELAALRTELVPGALATEGGALPATADTDEQHAPRPAAGAAAPNSHDVQPAAAAGEPATVDDGAAAAAQPLTQEEIRRLVEQIRSEGPATPASADGEATSVERRDLEPEAAVRAVEDRLQRLASATVRVIVEDKRHAIPLVPLHRALVAVRAVEDVSLVSYAGGKAVVSVRAVGELDAKALERAVARALGRHCEVAFRDPTNLLIHVSEE